jgi:hypothetical protein
MNKLNLIGKNSKHFYYVHPDINKYEYICNNQG